MPLKDVGQIVRVSNPGIEEGLKGRQRGVSLLMMALRWRHFSTQKSVTISLPSTRHWESMFEESKSQSCGMMTETDTVVSSEGEVA